MALPILDGNQSATTLSSVVTGGEHIVAHSVVSLGTTAIANITSAVSGSVVSISNFPSTQTIAGTVTANVPLSDISGGIADYISGTDSFVVSPLGGATFPISGTVTAAAPNGSLTTRFGTPTTANTAFATSAVTNANRKYLLIQNVTTGSNVITVGIGFTPTTTQGIQLTAGAGITFESSYIPTGAVYVLSSVTASNFTILEA